MPSIHLPIKLGPPCNKKQRKLEWWRLMTMVFAEMSQFFSIHPDNPQARLLRQAVNIIQRGGLVVYPTDSGYALGCQLENKSAVKRIRRIRDLDENHHLTLMCRDLSAISTYAHIDKAVFRLLKAFVPGAYTFLLKATSEVPKRMLHPKRRTLGLRVPNHTIALALLETLDAPLLSTSLRLPEMDNPLTEPEAIRDLLGARVDLVIDAGSCSHEPTTVIDLLGEVPVIIRLGKGDPNPFIYDDKYDKEK